MNNIFSYLKWRGDIEFLSSTFNVVDNLIFCAISYLKFDNCLKSDEIITLEELYNRYVNILEDNNLFYKNSEKLFSLFSQSKRYKNIKVARYIRINDSSSEKQFGAMTFILPTNNLVVVFSGTDESVVGWKEDFNLGYLDVIPAQEEAKKYLEEIIDHTSKNIFICGHSKGGNLAMYAAIFCKDYYKERIIKVYNNDGPGFSENVFSTEEFSLIKDKIITFLPEFSIIGNLFNNDSIIKIIDSYQIGILEHDLFSWKVEGTEFILSDEPNKITQNIMDQINEILNNLSKDTKRKIVNAVYDLLLIFNVENIDDIFSKVNFSSLLKKYDLNLENIDILLKILNLVFQLFKKI